MTTLLDSAIYLSKIMIESERLKKDGTSYINVEDIEVAWCNLTAAIIEETSTDFEKT